jgi:hypothetical protein
MLHLKHADVPRWPFGRLALFASSEAALRHLCDHVLTRPEAHYWSQLIPAFEDHLDPGDDDALYRFARSLWSAHPPIEAAQVLYEGYGEAIVQAISEAIGNEWYWVEQDEEGVCYRGMGTSGVYVIWREHAVRTAMVLGYAAPPEPSRKFRKANPLPRQHAWRYRGAILRQDEAHYPPVQAAREEAAYHAFKRSARRVRKEFKNAWDSHKVTEGGGRLGSLHDGVPDFATWRLLRARLASSANLIASPHQTFSLVAAQ